MIRNESHNRYLNIIFYHFREILDTKRQLCGFVRTQQKCVPKKELINAKDHGKLNPSKIVEQTYTGLRGKPRYHLVSFGLSMFYQLMNILH